MNRDEIIAEIKALLAAELAGYKEQLQAAIPPEAQQKFEQTRDQGKEFIQENPWTAVAIAAAFGLVLGRLFSSRGE